MRFMGRTEDLIRTQYVNLIHMQSNMLFFFLNMLKCALQDSKWEWATHDLTQIQGALLLLEYVIIIIILYKYIVLS